MKLARGHVYALLTALLGGLTLAVGKLGVNRADPLAFAFWVFTFASAWSGVWVLARRERLPIRWRWFVPHTALAIVAIHCFWQALHRLDPAVSAFLGRLEVPVTVLCAVLFLRERLAGRQAFGVGAALAGLLVMKLPLGTDGDVSADAGFWFALVSALCFGVSEVFGKPAVRAGGAATFVFVRSLCVAAALGAGCGFPVPDAPVALVAALTAAIGPAGGRMFYMMALRTVPLSHTAILTQSQPVFTALAALAIFGTWPGLLEWAGGGLIVAGCVLLVSGTGRETTRSS